jgi:hypothetical protein
MQKGEGGLGFLFHVPEWGSWSPRFQNLEAPGIGERTEVVQTAQSRRNTLNSDL